jgi:hypothetical protein
LRAFGSGILPVRHFFNLNIHSVSWEELQDKPKTRHSTPSGRVTMAESALGSRPRLPLLEVVVVDLRHAQRFVTDAYAVVHHESGELLSVDEHDAAARFRCSLLRVLRDGTRVIPFTSGGSSAAARIYSSSVILRSIADGTHVVNGVVPPKDVVVPIPNSVERVPNWRRTPWT